MRFDLTIAGELNLDLILYGLPQEMALERELLASDFQVTLGSSSAILAHNIACLGMRVGFISRVGADDLGRLALERLQASGVDLSRVSRGRTTTNTGVTIMLPQGKQRHILTYPGTMFEMDRQDIDIDYLASAPHFHLSSLFLHKALQPALPEIFRALKARGMTISLDTNDDPDGRWDGVLDEVLPLVDLLLPNEDEAKRISGCDDLEKAFAVLADRVPLVAVKRGGAGATVLRGTERIDVPGLQVSPVDSVGAGDSFNAGFLAAWLRGAGPRVCAACGNIAGALSTLRTGGTEAFRDKELRQRFLEEHGFYKRLSALQAASDRSPVGRQGTENAQRM